MTTDVPRGAALDAPRSRPRPRWRRLLVENLAVLVAFAAAGAGGGWLWSTLWDPPRGAVQDHQWLYLDLPTISRVFSGTALYVAVGLGAGVVLGVLAALVCRVSELATLAVVLVGSVLAGLLAYHVGLVRSPANPRLLALVLPEGTELPGTLQVTGHTPFVAWPLGALLGLGVTYLLTAGGSAGAAQARRIDLDGGTDNPLDESTGSPAH